MGNCLVLEEKVIRVMKNDGKILDYRSPIRVQQVLSDFSGHVLSADSFSSGFQQHLQPDAKLLSGHLYYLIPLPSPSPKSKKKKVRFSNPEVNDDDHHGRSPGVQRIKLIISKQELRELLQREGISVHDTVSQTQSKQSTNGFDTTSDAGDNYIALKPVLESIAELN
ncbi:hypothetical protein DITRI_Ditri06bG0043900 [Diplodiscus trichospermus]